MLNREKTSEWIATITQDRKFQEETRRVVWSDNIRRYLGRFHIRETLSDADFVNVNFVFSYIKTVIPAVYSRDPFIFVTPRKEENIPKANSIQAVINYLWREINLKEEVKRAILDTLLFGIGWIKIGYTAEFGTKLEESALVPEDQRDRKTPEGKVIEFNEYIKEENVFGTRLSPYRVIVPRGYHRFVDMPYIIEERLEDIKDVKNNKSYKHTDQLVPTHKVDTGFTAINAPNMTNAQHSLNPGQAAAKQTGEEQTNKIVIWEVWDKRSQKVYTFGKGATLPLKEEDWVLEIEGFPYIPLRFNITPDSDENSNFYSESDVEPLIPQLKEQSRLRTAMVKHRKKFMRKYIVEEGAMDQDQKNILMEPETGLIAEVNDITKIIPTQDVTVPADLYRVNDVIKQDLREISGISQIQMGGGSAPGVNTATEAQLIQQGASLRIGEKQDQIEDFTREIARKLIQIVRQFVDRNFMLRTMVEGREVDITATKEDLQAEVDISIEAGSTQPPSDTAIERKQIIDLSIGVLQNPFFQRFVNPRVLLQKIAKTFPALRDSKIFTGGAEDEQAIAQQENQLLQQGMIQLVHPNDDHQLHLEVHSPFAQDPESTSPEMAQHIKSHMDFMGQRLSVGKEGRPQSLTPANITEQGAMRPTDVAGSAREGGVGTQPPAGGA